MSDQINQQNSRYSYAILKNGVLIDHSYADTLWGRGYPQYIAQDCAADYLFYTDNLADRADWPKTIVLFEYDARAENECGAEIGRYVVTMKPEPRFEASPA